MNGALVQKLVLLKKPNHLCCCLTAESHLPLFAVFDNGRDHHKKEKRVYPGSWYMGKE